MQMNARQKNFVSQLNQLSRLFKIALDLFVTLFLKDNEEQQILSLPLFSFCPYRDTELKEAGEKVRVLITDNLELLKKNSRSKQQQIYLKVAGLHFNSVNDSHTQSTTDILLNLELKAEMGHPLSNSVLFC